MNQTGDEWWLAPKGEATTIEPPVKTAPRPVAVPPEPEGPERVTEAGEKGKPDRRRSVIIGAAGAALAGAILFTAMPDDTPKAPSGVTATVAPGAFLPPAGEAPEEAAEVDAAQDPASVEQAPQEAPPAKAVGLSMRPAGHGRTGALVNVTIRNDTDDTLTVMSSMMRGDNRSAMVGEGTLAPGSRRVEPGQTAEGTVEFATKKPPSQIVLLGLSGEVVATT